jgi:hypothetical protein
LAELVRPNLQLLDGRLAGDGWTTRTLALLVEPAGKARVIKAVLRNPHYNGAYLRNEVSVALDGEEVFAGVVFAGESVTIERPLPARQELLLELKSEAWMAPDVFDDRERAVILKLTERD